MSCTDQSDAIRVSWKGFWVTVIIASQSLEVVSCARVNGKFLIERLFPNIWSHRSDLLKPVKINGIKKDGKSV